MTTKLTRLTHKIAIQLHLVAELYHLQFLLQAASPETFEYTLVLQYIKYVCRLRFGDSHFILI
jgi:hypothetical protein